MATDIAFVVGCMAILGPRVPHGLRVVVLSLAIIDDIGAILVIALGYSQGLSVGWLLVAAGGLGAVVVMLRLGVRGLGTYFIASTFVWFSLHESGIHATLAGVILGLLTPARSRVPHPAFKKVLSWAQSLLAAEGWQDAAHRARAAQRLNQMTREIVSPLEYLILVLHPWVAFAIMPMFALANAGVALRINPAFKPIAWAVAVGLCLGKPLGVLAASWLAVKSCIARLPDGVGWRGVAAGGILAGIGFTMAFSLPASRWTARCLLPPKLGSFSPPSSVPQVACSSCACLGGREGTAPLPAMDMDQGPVSMVATFAHA